MPTNEERVKRWLYRNLGRSERDLAPNGTIFYYANKPETIYSYGPHFPLAHIMHDRHSKPWALLNGDRVSASTTRHQGSVRAWCNWAVRKGHLQATMIVPFSALGAAGIRTKTIEPLEIRDDRFEEGVERVEPTGRYLRGRHGEDRTRCYLSPDSSRHAQWISAGELPAQWISAGELPLDVSAEDLPPVDEDGWYLLYRRHVLGDSLFRARTEGERTRKRFLSSFDYNEREPLYFLCELPRSSKAATVAEAFEDLKPQAVKDAEAAGLEVERQGDVFAIPTELTTHQLKALTPYGKGRIVKRPKRGLIGTNHTASEVLFATEDRVYARGCLYHEPGRLREPDHVRRKMGDGKTWHLLIKNTVPQQRQRTQARSTA